MLILLCTNTSNGVANVTLNIDPKIVIGRYYATLTMTTSEYHFVGHAQDSSTYNTDDYTYKQSYQDDCGSNAPTRNSSDSCNLKYAVWKWTNAYTTLGSIACVLVFISGVTLFILGCCRERLLRCFCGTADKDERCCRCLCSCTTELALVVLNFFVFILFAFSWAIIIGLKYAKNLNHVIAEAANQALNSNKNAETYHFSFSTVQAGKSLGPLAAASFLALIVTVYLVVTICCGCCGSCCSNSGNSTQQNNNNNKNKSMEMVSEEAEV